MRKTSSSSWPSYVLAVVGERLQLGLAARRLLLLLCKRRLPLGLAGVLLLSGHARRIPAARAGQHRRRRANDAEAAAGILAGPASTARSGAPQRSSGVTA